MTITEADTRLIEATLRHELMPSADTKQALDLAIAYHASFPETGEQGAGPDRVEHDMPGRRPPERNQ